MNKLPRSFFGITTPVLRSAMHTSRAPAIPFTRYTREHTSALGCRQYLSVVPSVPVIIEPKISSVTKRTFSSESGTKEVFPSVSYLSKIQDPKFRFTPDAYAACQKEIESLPGLSRLSETEITKMVRDILDSALNGVKDLDEGFVPDGLQGISACLEALPLERIRTPALKRE